MTGFWTATGVIFENSFANRLLNLFGVWSGLVGDDRVSGSANAFAAV